MKQRDKWKTGALLSALALSTLGATQVRAEVLEQKWVAGQQLSYDINMDGTMRLTAPAEMPLIGGLPLEMLVKGDGQSTFDTREVDEFGTALVAPRLERMHVRFNETTFNQNGSIGYRDGRVNFLLNGQSVGTGNMDVSRLSNPDFGVRFTRSLRVTGVQPLRPTAEAPPADDAAPAPRANNLPVDIPAAMQAMIVRAIPPLLPTHDVSIGDTWTTNIEWPTVPGVAPAPTPAEPPGTFNFRALAIEEVAGRQAWRIAVDGVLRVSDLSTQAASDAMEKRRQEGQQGLPFRLPNVVSMTQKMKGDVWFDPTAGQVVKVDMRLDTASEGRNVAGRAASSVVNFNGRLQMDLRKTSFAGNQ